jgi:predicted transcriptional regulator
MKQEIWLSRAELLAPFVGKGFTVSEIAKLSGLCRQTVKSYIQRFELDNGEQSPRPKTGVAFKDRIADIRRCALEGKTRREAAKELGLKVETVALYARQNGIEFVHASSLNSVFDAQRAEAMASMYRGGKTLSQIGGLYGLTRERVRQIISKHHGLTAADGGSHAKALERKAKIKARKDQECLDKYGCTHSQYRELVALRKPTRAWHSQRRNSINRGIEWNLKLWEWWRIWQESGKWAQRGKRKGEYVMCRFGDVGAYEVGNVYIATASHNCSVQPNHPLRKKNYGSVAVGVAA